MLWPVMQAHMEAERIFSCCCFSFVPNKDIRQERKGYVLCDGTWDCLLHLSLIINT